MNSYFEKGFTHQLHDLNRTDSEHDLPKLDHCQNKENVETLSDVKYVPEILDSIDSTSLEDAKGNEIIPLDIREKLHKIPQLPDEEVKTAIAEVFADNSCDGPLTSSCSLEHSSHAHDNSRSTTDCLLETCRGNNINLRKELKSISSLSSSGHTEKRADENLSMHLHERQNKDEVIPVTPLTLLSSDERYKHGDDSNTDGNTKEILDLGKQKTDEDAQSHRHYPVTIHMNQPIHSYVTNRYQ